MAAAVNFGSLEYVQDRYSKSWCWKIAGERAVGMLSKLVPESWYGENATTMIIPDTDENIGHLARINERYPMTILSKSVWQRRVSRLVKPRRKKAPKTQRLARAKPGKQFRGKLLNFQKEGLDFLLKSSGNALLADEMGLGKTVQTLAYLSTEKQTYPALVVSSLVTLRNWEREIKKFLKAKGRNGRINDTKAPSVTVVRSGRKGRLPRADFYVINYDLLYKRANDLAETGFRSLVCDEVQNLRSKTTQKYRAVKRLAALPGVNYRIGLSGTPIYNRGSEIWPIVNILRPGLLGSFSEFCEYFCYVNDKGKAIVLKNRRDSLRYELQKHVMLRRKKSDVLGDLKEKVRYKEVVDADTEYYLDELDKIWRRLESEQKADGSRSTSMQRAIQSERQVAGVAKIPYVITFVREIMEIEESVVVFCHHRAIHELLHKSLAEFSPLSIIGGQTDDERQRNIDAFQSGRSKLLIAGLRAGNVGITLTRARYVIFAELDWSPAIHHQAEDRLHRIGQKNTVFAYYLIGNGTLDDHVASVLVDKSYEIDSIMDGKPDAFENRDKAKLILAQIHDKLRDRQSRG